MSRKAVLPFLILLLLAVPVGFSSGESKKSLFDTNVGWHDVRVALKKVFDRKQYFTLVSITAQAEQQLAVTGNPCPTRRHLSGNDGFSFPLAARTSNHGRVHLGDGMMAQTAFILEGDRSPRAVCRQIPIQTVYQPLAVVMPNLRSPPRVA